MLNTTLGKIFRKKQIENKLVSKAFVLLINFNMHNFILRPDKTELSQIRVKMSLHCTAIGKWRS